MYCELARTYHERLTSRRVFYANFDRFETGLVEELDHAKSKALESTFKSFLSYVRHKKLQDFLPEPLHWLPLDWLTFRKGKSKPKLDKFLHPPLSNLPSPSPRVYRDGRNGFY